MQECNPSTEEMRKESNHTGAIIKEKPLRWNLENYDKTYRKFKWEDLEDEFEWFSNNKINAAHEAIDKQANSWRKNKVALYYEGAKGERETFTFQDMKILSNKFANILKKLCIEKGDRVFTFMGRIPQLYISIGGIAKIGAICSPLFGGYGPEAIKDRIRDCNGKVIVCSADLKSRIDEVRKDLPDLQHIIVVGAKKEDLKDGDISYENEMAISSWKFDVEPMDKEDALYILYTSGTTGKPKGIVHVHGDIIPQYITTKWVLDLRDEDIYWCTADPGWITGTVYGIWGPWLNGVSQLTFDGRFDAEKWYQIIDEFKVTVWYTAPTALRMLMKAGFDVIKKYDLSSLRHIASVGEPLNPEVIRWGLRAFSLPIHDTWWQTETGTQLIVNFPCMNIKPGSMGKPFPGIKSAIINEKGEELPPGHVGLLAIKPRWPSMMRSIWNNKPKYDEYFKISGWYTTGDTAYMDKEGYYWFIGRADDVIKTAGERVGPFEVESTLIEHPSIAEAGVIGKPDAERGQIIKAFIVLRQGFTPSEELKKDIQMHVKKRLAAHAYPREIEFRDKLPKTRSGKIMRRVLKAWEAGIEVGDLSALEE